MTLTERAFETFGIPQHRTTGQIARARKMARRATDDITSFSPSTMWLALAGVAVAGSWLVLTSNGRMLGRRAGGRRVRDVMVTDVLTIDASATLIEAARRMKDANIGVLPVVEAGRLRGILTDRDIVVRALAQGSDPATTRVSQVATKELLCARPDWDVEDAMHMMAEHQIGRLPVVDDETRVVGIVTLSSLALRSRGHDEALETAQEVSRRSARIA
jgi:CBS domain-containing protein